MSNVKGMYNYHLHVWMDKKVGDALAKKAKETSKRLSKESKTSVRVSKSDIVRQALADAVAS